MRRFRCPKMTPLPKDSKPFEYVDVGKKIPNYTPGRQWGTQGEPRSQQQKPLAAGGIDQAPGRAEGLSRRAVRFRKRISAAASRSP